MKLNHTFEIEQHGDTVILAPLANLRELDDGWLEGLYETILDLFEFRKVKWLVLDLRNADYVGSSALGFFVKLWELIQAHGGDMALCNASPHAEDVLKAAHLDTLWPLCASRSDALMAISDDLGD